MCSDRNECAGDRYVIDGHLGWLLLPGPRLRELYPDVCPQGHRDVRVTLGWERSCRAITCSTCWDARVPDATAYYCTCRADLVSPDQPEIPPDLTPMHPAPPE
jgi:hypothetical protein